MKYSVFFISFCYLTISSCSKKESPAFNSYLRGQVDGVAFECTENIRATHVTPGLGGDVIISVYGGWGGGNAVEFLINQGSLITPGVYDFSIIHPSTYGRIFINSIDFYAGGGDIFCACLRGSGKITILEISSEYVKGTFEFTTGANASTGIFKTVTNGEFHIKRG